MYKLTRHVIVEGPNGGGKTTLTDALRAAGLPYHHTGGPKTSSAEIFIVMTELLGMPPSIVDRVPAISQVAYDWACEREELVPPEQVWKFFQWPRPATQHPDNPLKCPVVVYCRPSLERLLAHVPHGGATHPEEHRDEIIRNRRRIVGTYDRLLGLLSARRLIRVYPYDWEAGATAQGLLTALCASGDVERL